MKLLLMVTAALVGACLSSPAAQIPIDNSHYEEETRFIWMSDDKGMRRLVDLREPLQTELMQDRNGANNRYFFFSRNNRNNPREIVHNNVNSIWNAGFAANIPTVVLVHGWTGNVNSPMNPIIRDAVLGTCNCNVIVLDWGAVASANYVTAVNNVPSVGQFLGNFLTWLVNQSRTNWNSIHLVGFSLGAHVVGVAGRTTGNRPIRITGLDPAGPLWWSNNNALRASDGQYVETIHTDGGLQGIMTAIGNANFYPNGGRNAQPGCSTSQCSHSRAYDLFAATVWHNHLIGRQCTNIQQAENNACTGSTLHMGNNILNKRGNGIFGLRTGATWPF